MKYISLTKGKQVIVDNKDFEYLNQFKWHYLAGYAARRKYPENKYIYMHRFILGITDKNQVDHINLNGLDNRRENLRKVNKSQNMRNTILRKTNTSGYKGVYLDKRDKRWEAEITINYKKIHLGRYKNIKEAALAYNTAASKYFGEFARLNTI